MIGDAFKQVDSEKRQQRLDELYAGLEETETQIAKEGERIRELTEQSREVNRSINRAKLRRDRALGVQAYLNEQINKLVTRLME